MTTDISEDELLKAIQEVLLQPPDDGKEPGTITRPEVQRELGTSRDRCTKALKQLVDSGVLVYAMVYRGDAWGSTPQRVKGYRFVAK